MRCVVPETRERQRHHRRDETRHKGESFPAQGEICEGRLDGTAALVGLTADNSARRYSSIYGWRWGVPWKGEGGEWAADEKCTKRIEREGLAS